MALAKVEGVELGGSLEVPIALAEVEEAEPGGALTVVVISGSMCRGLTFGISRCRRAATVAFRVVVGRCNR